MSEMDPAGEPAIEALEKLRDEIRANQRSMWRVRIMVVEQAIVAVREAYTAKPSNVVSIDGQPTDWFARFMQRHGDAAREYLGLIGYDPGKGPEDAHRETT